MKQNARIPGPAEYIRVENNKNKGPSFGAKRDAKMPMTPGPGTYDTIEASNRKRPQTGKAQSFSQTQRPDLWQDDKKKGANLGPAYEARSDFNLSSKKGPTMGRKTSQKVSNTPGPGQYSNASVISMVKQKGAVAKIGTTKRPDNFTNKNGAAMPGPGGYLNSTGTFGKDTKGGAATMGSKYKPLRNDNPGPG